MLSYISGAISDSRVDELEQRMRAYYAQTPAYYEDIQFALNAWSDPNEFIHQDLVQRCSGRNVCEVGCGRAGILRSSSSPPQSYYGCDFAEKLISENERSFPEAHFSALTSLRLPYDDESFDVVFCVFVLEHVVRPREFLEELARICAPAGQIAILCPDFYARGNISSQRMGRSGLSGREKLAKGQFRDAMTTFLLSRIIMPLYLKARLRNADREPVYLLNTKPTCFELPFSPDVDAVYVTHQGEIDCTLERCGWKRQRQQVPAEVQRFADERGLIYAVYEHREQHPNGK